MCSDEFIRRSVKHVIDLLEDTQHALLDIAADEEGCRLVRLHIVQDLQPVSTRLISLLEELMSRMDPKERAAASLRLTNTKKG